MAISKPVTLPSGIYVSDAYIRISGLEGSKEGVDIQIAYYVSKDNYLAGKPVIQMATYTFVPSVTDGAPNFIKQGYEYLKTLPEFAGYVDDLD